MSNRPEKAKVYTTATGGQYVKLKELWETAKFRDQIGRMAKIPTAGQRQPDTAEQAIPGRPNKS